MPSARKTYAEDGTSAKLTQQMRTLHEIIACRQLEVYSAFYLLSDSQKTHRMMDFEQTDGTWSV
jgi:hypothetical protein